MSRRLRDYRRALARLAGPGMGEVGELALLRVSADAMRRAKGNASGRVLKRRSGKLSASVRPSIQRAPGSVSLTLLSDSPYALIHEQGGKIRGKPWLTFKVGGSWRTVREVVIPRRPWLAPALQEAAAALLAPSVHDALRVALEEG